MIIVDEAHCSQYDLIDELAGYIREAHFQMHDLSDLQEHQLKLEIKILE